MNYRSIINEVAMRNGVSPEEVRAEMENAIGLAFQNQGRERQGVWAELAPDGVQPAPEDVIFRLAAMVMLGEFGNAGQKQDGQTG